MPNFRRNTFLSFIFLLCGINSAWAEPPQSEIAFQNSSIRFQATKTKSKFTFSDNLGPRSLEIKKCNRKVVEDFWRGLVDSVNSLQGSGIKDRLPSSSAWVQFDGIKFQVLEFEPAIHFFNKVPNNSQVLFSESRRLCKK